MTKWCSKCRQEKDAGEFCIDHYRGGKLHPCCKVCDAKAIKKYKIAHHDKVLAKLKEWQRTPHGKEIVTRLNRQKQVRKHGLELTDYDRLFAAQLGRCAICGQPEKAGKCLSIDHNHATGQVRELLCSACNRALGLIRENPQTLVGMIRYVEKHNG